MKTTNEKLVTFANIAQAWLQAHSENTKFRYALKKVMQKAQPLLTAHNEQLEDLNIEHCATDKDGVILREASGAHRFTKEGLKARNNAIREWFRETEIEVEVHLCDDVPELTEAEREAFEGFVLKPEEAPKLEVVA